MSIYSSSSSTPSSLFILVFSSSSRFSHSAQCRGYERYDPQGVVWAHIIIITIITSHDNNNILIHLSLAYIQLNVAGMKGMTPKGLCGPILSSSSSLIIIYIIILPLMSIYSSSSSTSTSLYTPLLPSSPHLHIQLNVAGTPPKGCVGSPRHHHHYNIFPQQ